jgi:Skp family chaperone for outer membrane proteins
MKPSLKLSCLAAFASALAPLAALAAEHAATEAAASDPVMVQGLGIANIDAIVVNSRAFQSAQQQRGIVYKAQIDAANARSRAINAELKIMVDKFNLDKQAPGANQEALQQQAQAIQASQAYGQQEVNRILEPVALSDAYVNEQIREKLDPAIKSAMAKTRVSVIFTPNQIIGFNNAYNLSPAILTELNALIPTVNIKPPTGWEPLAVRQQRAAQQVQPK